MLKVTWLNLLLILLRLETKGTRFTYLTSSFSDLNLRRNNGLRQLYSHGMYSFFMFSICYFKHDFLNLFDTLWKDWIIVAISNKKSR